VLYRRQDAEIEERFIAKGAMEKRTLLRLLAAGRLRMTVVQMRQK
jgi:hypothetical protein